MSMISEQVKKLRIAAVYKEHSLKILLEQAADTIEALSEKLQAANMGKNGNNLLKEIRKKAQELSNQHWGDDERHLIGKGIQCMCVQSENIIKENMDRADRCYGGGWIACDDRLPEEGKEVLVYLKQGRMTVAARIGKEWVRPDETRTAIVVAWRELPEPYHP